MKIGILTFHRVYNYGAVLQAFSTQKILDDLGIENEIVDLSIPKQRDYTSLYSTKNGVKRFLKTLLLTPYHQKRKVREYKFNEFISQMRLSAERYSSERDLNKINDIYDGFLVGSDQVWNVTKIAEASDGYFLCFADDKKLKVSYASSIGNASYEDLMNKKNYLSRFDNISCREQGGAKVLSKLIGRDIPVVLDPTLLVSKNDLLQMIRNYKVRPYILYYSLDGHDKRKNNLKILEKIASKFGLDIKFITPEWPKHDFGEDLIDVGPKDFLTILKNASLVCTNSFHGTVLSIKLNVPFFVLEGKEVRDERKRSILMQLGLEGRILSSLEEIDKIDSYDMKYDQINNQLVKLQSYSYDYLKNALQ